MTEATFHLVNKVAGAVAGALVTSMTEVVGDVYITKAEDKYAKTHEPKYFGKETWSPFKGYHIKWYDESGKKVRGFNPSEIKLGSKF